MSEEVLGKAYDSRLMARIFRYTLPYWPTIVVIGLTMPALIALELAQPWLVKVAIDEHLRPMKLAGFDRLGAALVGLLLVEYVVRFAQSWATTLLGQRAMNDLRLAVHRHVLGLAMSFFDRTPIGRVMTRITSDVEALTELFSSGIIQAVGDLVKLAAIVGWLFWLDARLAAVTMCALPLLIGLLAAFRGLARRAFRDVRVRLARINQFLQEHVSGMKIVQLHRREREVAARFDEENEGFRQANRGAITYDAALFALVEAIGSIAVAAVIFYAARALGAGDYMAARGITVGLVVAFIEYINKFFGPIRDLSAKYTVMQSAMASAERIFQLLDERAPDAPSLAVEKGDAPPSAATGKVAIEHVTFGYRDGPDVLSDVSLDVPAGATVALVGATGSGKSTLVKTIDRLYDPRAGRVLLDGRDVRLLDRAVLRRRVACVSQDVFLFAGTIADNVALGDPAIGRDAVVAACARVGLGGRLADRGGVDAKVIERGANLSAGEKQLVAFARALARDPEVLILDEATASVDPEAEALLERAVGELMRGRTSIVIAHRLSTIRRADAIVVMHKGRIAEQGTHEELERRGGLYARLHALQT